MGFCVIDNCAWVFSQLPELVEAPDAGTGFNCLEVSNEQASMLAQTIVNLRRMSGSTPIPQAESGSVDRFSGMTKIEAKIIESERLEEITIDLNNDPPQSFDVSRQVMVFNSRLEFVELTLTGAIIERHVFKFPEAIKKLLTDDVDAQKRFSANYKMIGEGSKVSSKSITSQVEQLRKRFLKSMGSLGSVILRSNKDDFHRELENLEKKIDEYRLGLKDNLISEIIESKKQLINALIDRVIQNPPDELKYGVEGSSVNRAHAQRYLEQLLDLHMPSIDDLIKNIELKCVFKAVTYEMLSDETFQKKLLKIFSLVTWDKPMTEFMAAAQDSQSEMKI